MTDFTPGSKEDLENWQRARNLLGMIDTNARWVTDHAGRIEQALRLLPSDIHPEGRAEERLQEAIEQLDVARALCRAALVKVRREPLVMQAAE